MLFRSNPNKFCLYHRTTATTRRNASSSEMRSRSSSDEVDSTGSSDAGPRVEEIGQGPFHSLNRQEGKSNPGIGLPSGPSTPSPEGLKEEQTPRNRGTRETCKCITYDFTLNLNSFLLDVLLPFGMDLSQLDITPSNA